MAAQSDYKLPEDLKSRLKESYDVIAPTYNEWTVLHAAKRFKYLDKLLLYLADRNGGVKVLELGCGAGIPGTEKLLSYPHIEVAANDMSSTQISLAKENLRDAGARVQFFEGDMLQLSFDPATFDAVVAFFSIIHLPREEQVTMLRKTVEWLKPGGFFLANFAAEEAKEIIMEKWLAEKGWMFWSGWGAEGTLEKIKEAGMEVVLQAVEEDVVDANFLWVLARKPETRE